jgi:hypothetical protein
VALLQVSKQSLLLHLAVEKAFQSVVFKDGLLIEVKVLEIRKKLTVVLGFVVEEVDELADLLVHRFKLHIFPECLLLLHEHAGLQLDDELVVVTLTSLPAEEL